MSNNDDSIDAEKKQVAKLFALVELFPYYILRKTIGIIYIIIAATILVGESISNIFSQYINTEIVFMATMTMMFFLISLPIRSAFKLQTAISNTPEEKRRVPWFFSQSILWMIIGLLIVVVQIIADLLNNRFLFYVGLEFLIGLGQLVNYWISAKEQKYPGRICNEYLYFGIIIMATVPLLILFPNIADELIEITVLFGTYIFGLYILTTSNKVFLEKD